MAHTSQKHRDICASPILCKPVHALPGIGPNFAITLRLNGYHTVQDVYDKIKKLEFDIEKIQQWAKSMNIPKLNTSWTYNCLKEWNGQFGASNPHHSETSAPAGDPSCRTAGSAGEYMQGPQQKQDQHMMRKKQEPVKGTEEKMATSTPEVPSFTTKKRDCIDDPSLISPIREYKKACKEKESQPKPNNTEADYSNLNIAITNADGTKLTKDQARLAKEYLGHKVRYNLKNPGRKTLDCFHKSVIEDGALKLWCVNEAAPDWVKATVEGLPEDYPGPRVRVIEQSELFNKIRAVIVLPQSDTMLDEELFALEDMNDWARVTSWTVYERIHITEEDELYLIVGIPQDVLENLLNKGSQLSYIWGKVRVLFVGDNGTIQETPP